VFESLQGHRFFSFTHCPDGLWAPPSLPFSAYLGSFPGVNWPGCKVDHSPASTAEVKNEWSHTSTPFTRYMLSWSGEVKVKGKAHPRTGYEGPEGE
jgi:hypothetical protein